MPAGSMKRVAALLLTFALLPAQAKETLMQHMPTTGEMAALPEYCQARFGTNEALRENWKVRMGPDKFMHLHHYCHGLN